MRELSQKLYTGFGRTKAVVVALVLAVYLALVTFSGGSVLAALQLWAAVFMYIVLPGLLLARGLRTGRLAGGFGVPLAILLGSGFFAVLYCVCMRLGFLWLLQVLPPLMSLAWFWLWLRGKGLRAARKTWPPQPHVWLLALLCAALVLLFSFAGVIHYGRPVAVGDVLPNQDLLWNAGNAASFKLAFPPQDIRFEGVRLHYHYLTELLAGALSIVSGVAPYDILAFYLQPLMLCAAVLCLYRFARLVWPGAVRTKPLLFVFSLFLFSCASLWKILPNGISVFWNSHITHLVTNINSVTTSVVFLCIFLGLFITAARAKFRVPLLHYALLLCAFVLLIFAKGPLAGLVTIAAVLALLVGLPLGRTGWRGLVLAAVLGGLFYYVYTAMFSSGANDSMVFSLYGTLEKGYFANILAHLARLGLGGQTLAGKLLFFAFYALQTLLMAPAAVPLYLVAVGGDLRRFRQLTIERLLLHAMAVGGVLAFFLFNHPAMSQVYFFFGALFCIHLLAVDKIDVLRSKAAGLKGAVLKVFKVAVALLAALGLLTSMFLYVHLLGSGLRQLLRNAGASEKYPYTTVMNADDEAAALWLRDNAPRHAVFATNRIHTGARREGISNLYSALSERQAYMEGFQYAKTNMGVSEQEISRRLGINTALFDESTPPAEVARLMEENGVTYLVYTTQLYPTQAEIADEDVWYRPPGGQFAALELVFESETVYIYRLPGG